MQVDVQDRLIFGTHGPYRWLVSTAHYLGPVVKRYPQLVLDRYLAVTATDSGPAHLTAKQAAAGWEVKKGIAYSPRLKSTDQLPDHQLHGEEVAGFDEWYVFTTLADLGELSSGNVFTDMQPGRTLVFANYFGFMLDTTDQGNQDIVTQFWKQFDLLQPESWLADTRECFTLVSSNEEIFQAVYQGLEADYTEVPHNRRPNGANLATRE